MPIRPPRRVIGAIVAVVAVAILWATWPALFAPDNADTLVIGDGAVHQAADELARRFRQEGSVVAVEQATSCAEVAEAAAGFERVVVSFADWTDCGSWPGNVTLLVQQPTGGDPRPSAEGRTARLATDLFSGAEREPCQWWDTPGAGEDRPGLGQCQPDGTVAVVEGGELTAAGRERFARLVVESAG